MEPPYEVDSEDVEYGRAGDLSLMARVYRPRRVSHPLPALVDVHGGAWRYFDRSADAYFDAALAARGMVVVALDFRQAPENRYPSSVCDILAGVRFVRANAAALGVRAEQIGLIGGSSGGHLVLVAALRPHDAEFPRTPAVGAGDDVDASVSFALALWPIADPLARYRYVLRRLDEPPGSARDPMFRPGVLAQAQREYFGDEETMARAGVPEMLARRQFERLPPLWIAHPELDENVTVPMTEALVTAYRRAGGAAELVLFPGVGHGFANFGGEAADDCVERMWAFISGTLATPPA